MRKKTNGHPGQVLEEKFIKPADLSSRKLADAIRVPVSRINDIVKGKTAITADLALRLGKYFGNGPEFWLKLQMDHDLCAAGEEIREELEAIPQHGAKIQESSPAETSGRAAERKKIRDAWLEKNKDSDYIRGALDLLASADLAHPDDDIARAAIAVGDMDAVRKIEKAGFDRWAVPEVGYFAFLTPCLDVIEFLVGHGHNVNTVYGGYKFESVKTRYSGIRDLGTARPSESDYEWITTPLCQAVEHGFAEVVRYLIAVGADVNFRDYYGLTPLHFAADSYSLDTVKALVAGGADVNARSRPDHWGSNDDFVLYYMVLRGFSEGLRYLVEHG
ncbi:MAG: HigA family addiction module antidote protein, partial [Lentisphaeria bacterium]|nr:HigA family addiction module antidote protein [Lentisphaeria bacterium]